ncbi:MAG: hypothetical protein HY964_07780 [Ignavibacteriales bacterium]|nr:hypothetical protein [Ignavibacteriales bacterium]
MNDEPINLTLEQLEQRLSRQPASPLFARLAQNYLNLNRVEEAKQLCLNGLELYPNYSTARIVLELCYRAENRIFDTENPSTVEIKSDDKPDYSDITSVETEEINIRDEKVQLEIEDVNEINQPSSEAEIFAEVKFKETITEQIIPQPKIINVQEQEVDFIDDNVTDSTTNIHSESTTQKEYNDSTIDTDTVELNEIVLGPIIEEIHNSDPITHEIDITAPKILSEQKTDQDSTVKDESTQIIPEKKSSEEAQGDDIQNGKPQKEKRERLSGQSIVSKTLAEIYASQGEYAEAIDTYSLLMIERPERKKEIKIRIRELEAKLAQSISSNIK